MQETYTFIGHRLQDMSGFGDCPLYDSIKAKIADVIRENNARGMILLTDGLTGIGMWAAEEAIKQGAPFYLYVPYKDPQSKWPFKVRKIYSENLRKAKKIITLSTDKYKVDLLHEKDERIIRDADLIYSFFKEPVGLYKYINRENKETIDLIWEVDYDDYFIVL